MQNFSANKNVSFQQKMEKFYSKQKQMKIFSNKWKNFTANKKK